MPWHTTWHPEFSSCLSLAFLFSLVKPSSLSFSLTSSLKWAIMSLVELSKFCHLERPLLFTSDLTNYYISLYIHCDFTVNRQKRNNYICIIILFIIIRCLAKVQNHSLSYTITEWLFYN